MKMLTRQIDDLQSRRFEADLEASIRMLFARFPSLCGFSLRDPPGCLRGDDACANAPSLLDVSVYPMTGLRAPAEICDEIVAALVLLVDDCPAAAARLRERTFARTLQ